MIGVLTAVIGDLASQFGCWIGLKDAVTAISFVALGTSVPGTTGQTIVKQSSQSACFRYIRLKGVSRARQICRQLYRKRNRLKRCQCVLGYWNRLDDGCGGALLQGLHIQSWSGHTCFLSYSFLHRGINLHRCDCNATASKSRWRAWRTA